MAGSAAGLVVLEQRRPRQALLLSAAPAESLEVLGEDADRAGEFALVGS